MTKIRIDQLLWDGWNIEHIKVHYVSRSETEEAIDRISAHRHGYAGRIILIGRSGGRILSVIVFREKSGNYYIVTARDADRSERKLLYEKENQNNS